MLCKTEESGAVANIISNSEENLTENVVRVRCIFCNKNVGPPMSKRHDLHILRHLNECPYICPKRGCDFEGPRGKHLRDHLYLDHGYSIQKARAVIKKIDW